MVKKAGDGEILRCSFCNKDQNDVRKLIAGPRLKLEAGNWLLGTD